MLESKTNPSQLTASTAVTTLKRQLEEGVESDLSAKRGESPTPLQQTAKHSGVFVVVNQKNLRDDFSKEGNTRLSSQ